MIKTYTGYKPTMVEGYPCRESCPKDYAWINCNKGTMVCKANKDKDRIIEDWFKIPEWCPEKGKNNEVKDENKS